MKGSIFYNTDHVARGFIGNFKMENMTNAFCIEYIVKAFFADRFAKPFFGKIKTVRFKNGII